MEMFSLLFAVVLGANETHFFPIVTICLAQRFKLEDLSHSTVFVPRFGQFSKVSFFFSFGRFTQSDAFSNQILIRI